MVEALWSSIWFRLVLALLLAAAAYVGLRWIAFRRYRRRLRQVTRREALSLERQRIAMDMHDDLGADLSNLLMRTRMALDQDRDHRVALEGVEQGISAMMGKIDQIIWSLDPRMDSLRSTLDHIEKQAGEQATRAGLSFRATVDPLAVDRRVPAAFRRDLHLLVKEAMNNVCKHADARTVHLAIHPEATQLRIVLEDDGRGIDQQRMRPGRHGQRNMQRRAVQLSGDVRIARGEQGGTRCTIHVPYPRNHAKG